ncbi:MAG: hypothetical protein JNL50_13110 [Phycisphaerae bacterium]|nr:hypothetical protein [Phycisphaerae bacterium]
MCIFLDAAIIRVGQIAAIVHDQHIPAPCAISSVLLDSAIDYAQKAREDAELAFAQIRGVCDEVPAAISTDPRSWETNLALSLDRVKHDAGVVGLSLSMKKQFGALVSPDEADGWLKALKSHKEPLLNYYQELKAIPPPPTLKRTESSTNPATTRPMIVREIVAVSGDTPLTEKDIRVARTRTAYLEAHGSVVAALAALARDGHSISRSTFYNHLSELDERCPRWRESVQPSNQTGNLDGMQIQRKRGKSRENIG